MHPAIPIAAPRRCPQQPRLPFVPPPLLPLTVLPPQVDAVLQEGDEQKPSGVATGAAVTAVMGQFDIVPKSAAWR